MYILTEESKESLCCPVTMDLFQVEYNYKYLIYVYKNIF